MGSAADLFNSPGLGTDLPSVNVTPPLKQIKDPSDRAALSQLKPGEFFLDAAGAKQQRPHVVKNGQQWAEVPEGEQYLDPTNTVTTKPVTEPISFGPQLVYSMASDPDRQKQILSKFYDPAAIKQMPDGSFQIKQGNKWLKPGRLSPGSLAGFVAENAAPTVGAVGGGLLGAGVGAETGPGAAATGILGGGAGLVAGKAFNNMMLSMMGFHQTPASEATEMDEAALWGMGGEVAGRGLQAAAPAVKALGGIRSLKDVGDLLPAGLRKLFGTDPDALQHGVALARGNPEQGIPPVVSAPSSIHHDIPMIRLITEEWDPMFRDSPIKTSGDKFFEASAKKLGSSLGIQRKEPYLDPTHSVDLYQAGSQAQAHMADELAVAHAQLDQAIAGRRATLTSNIAGHQSSLDSQLSQLNAAADHLQKTAAASTKLAFEDVDKSIDDALKAAGTGANAGEAWRTVGDRLNKIDLGIQAVARRGYQAGYTAAGNTPMALLPVTSEARQLLDTLPEGFENQFPGVARQLESLSKPKGTGILDDAGEEIMTTPDVTLEQAHQLRNILRAKVDWKAPSSDAIDHQAKQLAGVVDKWMHDPSQPPSIQAGVKLIDKQDSIYTTQKSMLDGKAVQTIVKKMNEGFVDDAPALAKLMLDATSTEQRDNIRKLAGPKIWAAVQALDVKNVLESAVDSTGQVDAGRLANLVNGRLRDRVWIGSDIGQSVVQAANKLSLVRGNIKLEQLPGESIAQTLSRAQDYVAQAKQLAEASPIGLLEAEVKRLGAEATRGHREINQAFAKDPLGFLPSVGAIEAAEKILHNPDLFVAAFEHFGADSPAFTLLRQAYAESVLEKGGIDKVLKMPEIVQDKLFPGVTKDTAIQLAKDMAFITGGRSTIGGSLSGTARVTNPLTELSKLGGHPVATALSKVPILGPAIGRQVIGRYYSLITWGATHPQLLEYLLRGVEGSKEEREAARAAFQAIDRTIKFDPVTRKVEVAGKGGQLPQDVMTAIAAIESNRQQQQPVQRPPVRRRVPPPPPRPGDQLLQSLPR